MAGTDEELDAILGLTATPVDGAEQPRPAAAPVDMAGGGDA